MAEVVKFYPADAAKNPDNVLEQAIGEYESVLVLGWTKDKKLGIRSSTNLSAENLLWIVDSFKQRLLLGMFFADAESLDLDATEEVEDD